jgi:hypothetical protein
MNTSWKGRIALAAAAAALATLGWSTAAQAAPTPTPAPTATTTADATLAANLTFMRQEEQLARDVYTTLATTHSQAAPFANIARSEQRHFDTIGLLLQRYGIADPTAGRAAGSYADPELQALYTSLVGTGRESLAKAYEVGITIETKDIADLKAALAQTKAADVTWALNNLLNGSQNHLAAFTAAKDGRVLGTGNGQGMQNGRNRAGSGQPAGTPGAGQGRGGTGQGRAGNVDRPATCPVR